MQRTVRHPSRGLLLLLILLALLALAASALLPPAVLAEDKEYTPAPPAAPAPPAPPATMRPPRASRTPRAPEAPMNVETPEPPETPEMLNVWVRAVPRGWFGFGFECDCVARRNLADSVAVWTFTDYPRVYSVDDGSPAAKAGLRRGDVIKEIDGVSILNPDGGRRFGSIQPGQKVKWSIVRDGAPQVIVATAGERPESHPRVDLGALKVQVERIENLQNEDQMRRELAELNRRLAQIQRIPRIQPDMVRYRTMTEVQRTGRLRYAGVVAGSEVEVRGTGTVVVTPSENKDELVINTGETIVIIRTPRGAKSKEPKN